MSKTDENQLPDTFRLYNRWIDILGQECKVYEDVPVLYKNFSIL